MRECRIRFARDQIYAAIAPVVSHSGAAVLCLEVDDDEALAHHLRHVIDGVRAAASKHRELLDLLSSPAAPARTGGAAQ
jgi:hypothetical protein